MEMAPFLTTQMTRKGPGAWRVIRKKEKERRRHSLYISFFNPGSSDAQAIKVGQLTFFTIASAIVTEPYVPTIESMIPALTQPEASFPLSRNPLRYPRRTTARWSRYARDIKGKRAR